ncbi:hypothetical protein E1J77_21980 [Salmonella enterica subsp. enterica serovar Typhimurium]|nr:hypothetical protein [Salmonella enterica subsp. enterica serovar Typhimurium]ECP5053195.1 hypothetical protein [Salmonella enterica subsp. enterica serovar Typhimurium]
MNKLIRITGYTLLLGILAADASAAVTAGHPEPAVGKRLEQSTGGETATITALAHPATVVKQSVVPVPGSSGLIAGWAVTPYSGEKICTSGSIWTGERAVGAASKMGLQLSMTDTLKFANNVDSSQFVCGDTNDTVYLGIGYTRIEAGNYTVAGYFYSVIP